MKVKLNLELSFRAEHDFPVGGRNGELRSATHVVGTLCNDDGVHIGWQRATVVLNPKEKFNRDLGRFYAVLALGEKLGGVNEAVSLAKNYLATKKLSENMFIKCNEVLVEWRANHRKNGKGVTRKSNALTFTKVK